MSRASQTHPSEKRQGKQGWAAGGHVELSPWCDVLGTRCHLLRDVSNSRATRRSGTEAQGPRGFSSLCAGCPLKPRGHRTP